MGFSSILYVTKEKEGNHMAGMKNICGKIPLELHTKVRQEIEQREISTQQFIQQVIEEHFTEKGGQVSMAVRTVASGKSHSHRQSPRSQIEIRRIPSGPLVHLPSAAQRRLLRRGIARIIQPHRPVERHRHTALHRKRLHSRRGLRPRHPPRRDPRLPLRDHHRQLRA